MSNSFFYWTTCWIFLCLCVCVACCRRGHPKSFVAIRNLWRIKNILSDVALFNPTLPGATSRLEGNIVEGPLPSASHQSEETRPPPDYTSRCFDRLLLLLSLFSRFLRSYIERKKSSSRKCLDFIRPCGWLPSWKFLANRWLDWKM